MQIERARNYSRTDSFLRMTCLEAGLEAQLKLPLLIGRRRRSLLRVWHWPRCTCHVIHWRSSEARQEAELATQQTCRCREQINCLLCLGWGMLQIELNRGVTAASSCVQVTSNGCVVSESMFQEVPSRAIAPIPFFAPIPFLRVISNVVFRAAPMT